MPESGPVGHGSPGRGTLVSTVVLTSTLLLGLAALLIPVTMLVVPEVVVTGTIFSHNQNAESLAFVLTFLVLLPALIWLVPRYVQRFTGPGAENALAVLAAGLTLALGLAIGLIRASDHWPRGGTIGVGATVLGLWLLLAAVSLALAPGDKPRPGLDQLGSNRPLIWASAAVGALIAVLSLVDIRGTDGSVLLPALIVGAALFYAIVRFRLPTLSKGWGRTVDVLVFLLVVLAVPDMVIFQTGPGVDHPSNFNTYVIQFHQNLFLGPASQVLDGKVLLVDTVSQYGIGSIYFISGFFKLAGIGHGTLGFLDGFLSALVIATSFLVMRMAGTRRPLAAGAMLVTVLVMAWGLTYPIGGLLQHGAIRYGMPILLIAATTAGSRWPGLRKTMFWLSLLVVAISSIWALEAFLYTLATWVGLLAFGLVMEPGDRMRWLVRKLIETLLAMVSIHVLFALITLIASGSLPDWSLYLTYLKDFTTGDIGDLTYDYVPWSRGLGVGAFYLVSVIGLALLVWKRRDYVETNRTAFVAIAGSLSYGIGLYSYFVNRSLDHVLPYLLVPFFIVAVVWLSLALRPDLPLPRRAALGAVGLAMLVSVFAISAVGRDIPDRASQSLLAYAVPGGHSVKDGFDRLWNPPPLVAGADEGERLLEEEMPGESSSAVLTKSDLGVEALARAGRANSLGFTDPKENSWVPGPNRPIIAEAIGNLEIGDLMLVDQTALEFIKAIQDPKNDPAKVAALLTLEPLQGEALMMIDERFRLAPVVKGRDGLQVVELQPKKLEWGNDQ